MSMLKRALLAAPLPFALASGAFAQTAIPALEVTAPAPSLTNYGAVEDNTTARLRLWSSPGNNTVVPAQEFQEIAGGTGVREIFENTPGVFAQPKWGQDSRISIRGSGLARNNHIRGIRFYQDGIPLNQADGSGDLAEIDPLAYQRAEVYRGGNAFWLGANTLGGAVNFVTNTGSSARGFSARAEGGSYGFARGQLAYGGVFGPVDAYVSYTNAYDDGFRRHSSGQQRRLNANVLYRWNDQVETRVVFGYNNIWQEIPGAVSRQAALRAPKRPLANNEALNYQRNVESYRFGTITSIRPAEGVRFEVGASLVDRHLNHPIFQVLDNHTVDWVLFARGAVETSILGLRNVTTFGVNYTEGTINDRRFVNVYGSRGAQTYAAENSARTADGFFENTLYVLPNLGLVAGLQAGSAYRSSRNLLTPASSGSGNWDWVNPRFGVLYQITPQAQAYANVTWSTEAPTITDLTGILPLGGGFSGLKAQRAATVELGSRGSYGAVNWEVAAYHSWLRDEIQLLAGPTSGSSYAQNAGRTIHRGIELGLGATLGRGVLSENDTLSGRVTYTYSDFQFDGDRTYRNNQLPGVPRHVLRGELRYRHASGFWIAPNVDVVPEGFYADNANTLRSNPYALFGLRAGADLLDGRVGVFLDARNLGDRRYISSASVTTLASPTSALFEAGYGRTIYAGVQVRY
ncbi:TonB-dependent receptor [Rhodovarius crocodyli]|uniref:TonB-dependent receptor n=1 Tax=Rhodovarius crocodyli TaxID=1979269 RepID=A0A437MMQ3_9PROT|nr:TonB-dependent receptor [Rhodovarius crocodyli]RVT98938.1 TonB-dependent receptor [Rhodovarius crocodyli]